MSGPRTLRVDGDRYLDIDGAAAFMATTSRHIRRLVAERRLASFRVGRKVRIAESDLRSFLAAGRVEAR